MNDSTGFSGALGGGNDEFERMWEGTEAAKEFTLLPRGDYICHVVGGGKTSAKTKGTPGYRMVFRIIEGEHTDRQVRHTVWFTTKGMPYAKRDLAKLGITKAAQLDAPPPPGIRCRVRVVIRKNDEGAEHNEVREFVALGVDKIESDPFDTNEEDPEIPV